MKISHSTSSSSSSSSSSHWEDKTKTKKNILTSTPKLACQHQFPRPCEYPFYLFYPRSSICQSSSFDVGHLFFGERIMDRWGNSISLGSNHGCLTPYYSPRRLPSTELKPPQCTPTKTNGWNPQKIQVWKMLFLYCTKMGFSGSMFVFPKDPDPSLEEDWGFQSHPKRIGM